MRIGRVLLAVAAPSSWTFRSLCLPMLIGLCSSLLLGAREPTSPIENQPSARLSLDYDNLLLLLIFG